MSRPLDSIADAGPRSAPYGSMLLPLAVVGMLAVMVLPLPPMLLDVLISANLALAAVILLTTIFVQSPLDFSAFPSLLLGTTLFRLVLNIASTRLILSADARRPETATAVAGRVIETFSAMVAGHSLVVGFILFLILVLVQFVVITKGATRISEVAARFMLDGMPGRQLAIDADLSAGSIDESEARQRRERIGREAEFYGAMDGAAKFLRGDAVAGIVITLVNIVGGLGVGVFEKGWSPAESMGLFTRLTIGDGLVSQMPAFVISMAAGLIVTRSSSRQDLGTELTSQLTAQWPALAITGGFLGGLALLGMPAFPMVSLAVGVGIVAWTVRDRDQRREPGGKDHALADAAGRPSGEAAGPQGEAAAPTPEKLITVDPLELQIGYGLVRLADSARGGDLLDRIAGLRRQIAAELGFVMPTVRIHDDVRLPATAYRIRIRGNPVAVGEVHPDRCLAMNSGAGREPLPGIKTREPVFGLEAVWIDRARRSDAENAGYTVVVPNSVLATHLTEVVRDHAHELLTREETNHLLAGLRERAPRLAAEVLGPATGADEERGDQPLAGSAGETSRGGSEVSPCPSALLRIGDVQKVLQDLLRERVPIRDLETIVETLGDWAPRTRSVAELTQHVREALRRTICGQYAGLEPVAGVGTDGSVALPPEEGDIPTRGTVAKLHCVSLDPALEDVVVDGGGSGGPDGADVPGPPAPEAVGRVTAAIAAAVEPLIRAGLPAVVLASPAARAEVKHLIAADLPHVAVLGYNEIAPEFEVESLGIVRVTEVPAADDGEDELMDAADVADVGEVTESPGPAQYEGIAP